MEKKKLNTKNDEEIIKELEDQVFFLILKKFSVCLDKKIKK